jgi:hydroxymethylbilane synthase
VQCRSDDQSTLNLLAALENESTRKAVTAERAFLRGLGGGCAVPVAAFGEVVNGPSSLVSLTGLIISEDGQRGIQVTGEDADAVRLGEDLAQRAILRGAGEILAVSLVK